ncbi:unnamed protein product [Parascedosporium putredinis]|uniref:Major facilitator superfamily (MFS) profile domain-containing protein n=1 Tax=Parascedosporium putredinis TaxID=1442378 RepID=A0A9P1H101_9PEZI|nr:unnamed protein product [Parascedosporium putredinis]CAI7993319.1 unnamed protein product [Parascedosporium putredinis]
MTTNVDAAAATDALAVGVPAHVPATIPGGDPEKTVVLDRIETSSLDSAPLSSPSDFPDGGIEAWTVVFGAWLALFCTFGLITCVGLFLEYYVEGPLASYGPSTVSWIVSAQIFVQGGGTAIWGRIFDSYGPRWLLWVGTPVYCLGIMMTSLSTKYYQIFLSQAVLSALGSGAVFNAGLSSTATWFLKKRGAAFGILNSGSSVGGVVLPIMIDRLFKSIGFAWTLRVLGFLLLALCAIACITVKSRLPANPRPLVLADYTKPFTEMPMLMTMLGGFLFFWGMYLPMNYIIIQAKATGISTSITPYLLPIINAVSIIGRILPGFAADRFGRYNCIIIITALSGIATLALWIPSGGNMGAIIAYAVLFGFASGGLTKATILRIQLAPYLFRLQQTFQNYSWDDDHGPPTEENKVAVKNAFSHLEEDLAKDGPFDGVLGFSQGASCTSAFLLQLARAGAATVPFRFAILFSTSGIPEWDVEDQESVKIKIPTLHVCGEADSEWFEDAKAVTTRCADGTAELITHTGGHVVPKDRPTVDKVIQGIRRLVERSR